MGDLRTLTWVTGRGVIAHPGTPRGQAPAWPLNWPRVACPRADGAAAAFLGLRSPLCCAWVHSFVGPDAVGNLGLGGEGGEGQGREGFAWAPCCSHC